MDDQISNSSDDESPPPSPTQSCVETLFESDSLPPSDLSKFDIYQASGITNASS